MSAVLSRATNRLEIPGIPQTDSETPADNSMLFYSSASNMIYTDIADSGPVTVLHRAASRRGQIQSTPEAAVTPASSEDKPWQELSFVHFRVTETSVMNDGANGVVCFFSGCVICTLMPNAL
jgi:hypothetical protein